MWVFSLKSFYSYPTCTHGSRYLVCSTRGRDRWQNRPLLIPPLPFAPGLTSSSVQQGQESFGSDWKKRARPSERTRLNKDSLVWSRSKPTTCTCTCTRTVGLVQKDVLRCSTPRLHVQNVYEGTFVVQYNVRCQSWSLFVIRATVRTQYESTKVLPKYFRKYFRSTFVRCTRVVLHPRNSKKTSKRTYSPSIHVIRKKPAKKRTRDYTCTNTNKSVRASTRARYLRITTLSTFEGR